MGIRPRRILKSKLVHRSLLFQLPRCVGFCYSDWNRMHAWTVDGSNKHVQQLLWNGLMEDDDDYFVIYNSKGYVQRTLSLTFIVGSKNLFNLRKTSLANPSHGHASQVISCDRLVCASCVHPLYHGTYRTPVPIWDNLS